MHEYTLCLRLIHPRVCSIVQIFAYIIITVFNLIGAHPLFLADFYTINNQKYLNFTGFMSGDYTLDDVDERSAENSISGSLPKGVYNNVCIFYGTFPVD